MLAARVLRSGSRLATASRPATASFQQRIPPQQPRSYATEAKNTRPPLELFGVDGVYASALYTAAAKSSTLDSTASALSRLNTTFQQDAKLQTLLAAPTLTADDKSQLITELLRAAGVQEGGKEGTTVRNFLDTLSSNNRLSVLRGVCGKFEELMAASRGEVELTVTSAEELDRKTLQRVEQAVGKSRFVGQGRKLKTVAKVQPDIRGGLIVEIGDRTIDLSVASKMAKMNKLLQDTL